LAAVAIANIRSNLFAKASPSHTKGQTLVNATFWSMTHGPQAFVSRLNWERVSQNRSDHG
jgi:hypothetical protein